MFSTYPKIMLQLYLLLKILEVTSIQISAAKLLINCQFTWLLVHSTVLLALRKKCPYSDLFWPAFSRVWTEYGEILRILRIQFVCGEIRISITPNTDTFHAVLRIIKYFIDKEKKLL